MTNFMSPWTILIEWKRPTSMIERELLTLTVARGLVTAVDTSCMGHRWWRSNAVREMNPRWYPEWSRPAFRVFPVVDRSTICSARYNARCIGWRCADEDEDRGREQRSFPRVDRGVVAVDAESTNRTNVDDDNGIGHRMLENEHRSTEERTKTISFDVSFKRFTFVSWLIPGSSVLSLINWCLSWTWIISWLYGEL